MRGNHDTPSACRYSSPVRAPARPNLPRNISPNVRRRSEPRPFVEDEDDSLAREAQTRTAAKPLMPDDAPLSPGAPDAEQTLVDLTRPNDEDEGRSIKSNRSIIEKRTLHTKHEDTGDSAVYTPGPSDAETDEEELSAHTKARFHSSHNHLTVNIPEMKPRASSTYPTTRPSREVIEGFSHSGLVNSPAHINSSFLSPTTANRHDHETGFSRRQSARPAGETIPSLHKREGGVYAQTHEQPLLPAEPNTGRPKDPPSVKRLSKPVGPLPYDAEPSVFMPSYADYVTDQRPRAHRFSSEYSPDSQSQRSSATSPSMLRPESKRTNTDYRVGTSRTEHRRDERATSRTRAGSYTSATNYILSPKPERANTLPLSGDCDGTPSDSLRTNHARTFPLDAKRKGKSTDSSPLSSPSPGYLGPNRLSADHSPNHPSQLSSGLSSQASTRASSPAVPLKKSTLIRELSWEEWYAQPEKSIQLCPNRRMMSNCEWYSLQSCDSVDICTHCYDKMFAHTPLDQYFRKRPRDQRRIRCEMSHQWVIKSLKEAKRTKKPQHFLDFIQVASINFCDYLLQGDGTHVMPDRDRGDFFTLCDPITRHRARNFDVCEQCRNKLLALLPDLGDIFVPAPRLLPGEYLECDLRDDGPRWEAYIATFSRAVKIKKERSETEMLEILVPWLDCPPDRVCPGTEPQKQAAWHFVPSLEDFTICPDCYWKEIQSRMYRDHLLQRVEDRPQIVPDETVCHMSVKKLKHLFLDAAEANDMRTLIGEFKNRLALEREYRRAARKHEEYKADKYKYSLKRNTLRNQRAHASLIANQEKLSARAEDDAEHYRRKLRRLKKEWEARWDDPLRAGLQEPLDDDEDAD